MVSHVKTHQHVSSRGFLGVETRPDEPGFCSAPTGEDALRRARETGSRPSSFAPILSHSSPKSSSCSDLSQLTFPGPLFHKAQTITRG